ncbi:MAG: hypothetical protein IPN22_11350 [Bacteroidetes bacterium]|nr:hypothetical protein [Bacteroidota bacterium]
MNITPGICGSNMWFEKVDRLQLLKGFQTDNAGIFCIDTSARPVMNNYIARQKRVNLLQRLANFITYFWQTRHYSKSVYLTVLDYTNIFDDSFKNTNKFTQNEFSKLNSQTHKGLIALIKEYYNSPINVQGFRSIPFKQPGEGTKKFCYLAIHLHGAVLPIGAPQVLPTYYSNKVMLYTTPAYQAQMHYSIKL